MLSLFNTTPLCFPLKQQTRLLKLQKLCNNSHIIAYDFSLLLILAFLLLSVIPFLDRFYFLIISQESQGISLNAWGKLKKLDSNFRFSNL